MTTPGGSRPFLKWAGGKRQLLPVLRTYYPRTLTAYHEPFLGSGAVFFDLLAAGRLHGVPVWLSDENPDLVGCYLRVRDSAEAVIAALETLAEEHEADAASATTPCAMAGSTRRGRPGPPGGRSAGDYTVELAAFLIYLNRTGYNGLFRLNRSGGYNVPVGRYLRPHIVQAERLRAASTALSAPLVTIACAPFDAVAEPPGPARSCTSTRPTHPWGERPTSGITPPAASRTTTSRACRRWPYRWPPGASRFC